MVASQVLLVHGSPVAAHVTTVAGSISHTLALQTYVPLQSLPSSKSPQSESASHSQAAAPTQAPPLHASSVVHESPSLQLVPSVTGPEEHAPLLGSHIVASQGPSPDVSQTTTVFNSTTHRPASASQTSEPLHRSSSSSAPHSLSVVQVQVLAPPSQDPPAQVSPPVQGLPSSQGAALSLLTQPPLVESQASSVHGLSSSQSAASPAVQLPSRHTSPTVHASPSSHVVKFLVSPSTH